MRVAKRRPLLYQIIGKISGHHAARKRRAHSPRVEANFLEGAGNSGEYEQNRVYGVEQSALVVLEILVVAVWQSFESGKECCEIANGAGAGSTRKLQRIGIAFLRHHARTSRKRVAELNEPEFTRAVDDQVFGKSGEMRGGHCYREQQLGNEIPVANGIDAVLRDGAETEAALKEHS